MQYKFEKVIDGRKIIFETGKFAKQADGAVTVQCGGTMVLVTAVMSKEPKSAEGFFPLTVEYQEKTYAAGRIPGGFFKREGRPTEKEILSCRLIDRSIRPLFPEGLLYEVQIVAIVLSSDGEQDPDVLAVSGASCALSISDIPFEGPLAAVRVGMIEGNFIINPTYKELEESKLDLVVAGTKKGVIMVEAGASEVSESIMLKAIEFGHTKLCGLIELQEEMIKSCGVQKANIEYKVIDKALHEKVKALSASKLEEINKVNKKEHREDMMDLLEKDLVGKLAGEETGYEEKDIKIALNQVEKEEVRKFILEKGVRVDSRDYKTIRPIACEVGVLPRTHGSGLFTRGQTQSLSVVTLGTSADEQLVESLPGEGFKTFMLHYNFPSFSVGEVRPMRGPGRREIGHGALAARALQPVIPIKDKFPYTIRVVSEILESNGSSSMATVCAGTLALMDAGVPIKAPVAGIAMGLVKEDNKVAILTDIAGIEDHLGDMDFKVTGTRDGITALQMDIKIDSVDSSILEKALEEALRARLFILDKMTSAISVPRESLSIYAPRIVVIKVNPEKVKDVIGPGGKVIKKIIAETGVAIDIEDDGSISIASNDETASKKAIDIIKKLTEDVEVGKSYLGKVKRIMNFGAFVEVLPGKEGLVHVSELSNKYVSKVEDEVRIGDEILVKVIEIDAQGRVNLSRKKAMGDETHD